MSNEQPEHMTVFRAVLNNEGEVQEVVGCSGESAFYTIVGDIAVKCDPNEASWDRCIKLKRLLGYPLPPNVTAITTIVRGRMPQRDAF